MYLCKKKEDPMALRQGLNRLNKVLLIMYCMFRKKNILIINLDFEGNIPLFYLMFSQNFAWWCRPLLVPFAIPWSCNWQHFSQSKSYSFVDLGGWVCLPREWWRNHADMLWGDYRPKKILCWKLLSSRFVSHRTKVVIKYIFDFNVFGEMTQKKNI